MSILSQNTISYVLPVTKHLENISGTQRDLCVKKIAEEATSANHKCKFPLLLLKVNKISAKNVT